MSKLKEITAEVVSFFDLCSTSMILSKDGQRILYSQSIDGVGLANQVHKYCETEGSSVNHLKFITILHKPLLSHVYRARCAPILIRFESSFREEGNVDRN